MWHKHRSPAVLVREWRLPADERRAARAERRVEAEMRRQRDSEWTAERRAAAVAASAASTSISGPGGTDAVRLRRQRQLPH